MCALLNKWHIFQQHSGKLAVSKLQKKGLYLENEFCKLQ